MLAGFDIQGCINEQINKYFQDNPLTFSQLKTILINKKPLTEIQARVNDLLVKAKNKDIDQVKTALEAKAYKKQAEDDEQEDKKDRANQSKDEQLKARFNQELKKIATLINKHQEEQGILIQKTSQLYIPQMALPYPMTAPMMNQWRNEIQQHDIKLHFLYEKRKIIEIKLGELEHRLELNKQRQRARSAREQARIGYQSTKQNLSHTLSEPTNTVLNKSLNEQIKALEKKCTQLSTKAESMQFKLFTAHLDEHLALMNFKPNELTALQAILKLIKRHLHYHEDINLFQESLEKKKALISPLLAHLHSLQEKLKVLAAKNPILTATNEHLEKGMRGSIDGLEKNNTLKRNLGTTTWLLLGLTFLFSIPLILALSGTLSFLTPVLLYCIVSIPPALLLLSTIGVGITSLVYFFKARNSTQTITNHQTTMEANIKQMAKNEADEKELQLITIPAVETQIKKEERLREDLLVSLKHAKQRASDALDQAKNITPTSIETLPMFQMSDSKQTQPKEAQNTEALSVK